MTRRDRLRPHNAVIFDGSRCTAFSNDLIAASVKPRVLAHSPHLTHVSMAVVSYELFNVGFLTIGEDVSVFVTVVVAPVAVLLTIIASI